MSGPGDPEPARAREHTETVEPSGAAASEARFTPGALLAGRYRIVAPLGRGGMGEVYRADDTRLGQPVALKFLTSALASDAARLARLVDEVRIGRQISHPNVCRLYDLTEAEGHHFLVMEYVDGEDLASLLRRIGRLPAEKALEIARHVCAGLAAAHDKDVIHRDLKPANVMIDGHGQARIADFGVATLAHDAGGEFVGTPAYMSPEQLAGVRCSPRSDVFALGLVLYETFTGRRAFDARSVEELRALHAGAKPSAVSDLAREVEPVVAHLIQRCLARDPAQRPESARAVLAGLPGGDPLQAALVAGQTPSPQMVAAASTVGDLRPRLAWACLVSGLAGVLLVFWLGERVSLRRFIEPPMPPAALEVRAREVLDRLGYKEPAVDAALRFGVDRDLIAYLKERLRSSGHWDQLRTARPGALVASYRESPQPLVATSWRNTSPWDFPPLGRVGRGRPPLDVAGMTETVLDAKGRLVSFVAVPPRVETSSGPWGEVDWSVPLAEAGLSGARLHPSAPRWTAPVDTDRKAAWDGVNPDQPQMPIHVEAASYHGRPVYFEVQGPWRRPTPGLDRPRTPFMAVTVTTLVLNALILAGCAALARRNLRLGRGDRRGARRIALFASASVILSQLLLADHTTDVFAEHNLVFLVVAQGAYAGLFLWALYLALEPAVRRRWPYALVSWTRLLSGRLRDPLVGRDVLLGMLAGLAVVVMLQLTLLAPAWLGGALRAPRFGPLEHLADERQAARVLAFAAAMATLQAMTVLFNFYLFYAWLRRLWLAALLLFVEFALFFGLGSEVVPGPFVGVMLSASLVGVLVRLGLLALTALWFTFLVLLNVPLTLDWREWYAGRAFMVMAFFGLALVAAAYGSLGGKPPFGRALFEDEP